MLTAVGPPGPVVFEGPGGCEDEEQEAARLADRVAALRRLAAQDKVPALQESVQKCAKGATLTLLRAPTGRGLRSMLQSRTPIELRFQVPESLSAHISEPAVVLANAMVACPFEWQGREVLELGCGAGLAGITAAALGARVVLTDVQERMGLAGSAIALNSPAIRSAEGFATFCPLDWAAPRATGLTFSAVAGADVAVATEPVVDPTSLRMFLTVMRELFGHGGDVPPLCPRLGCVLVAHKHRPGLCISSYVAPMLGAQTAVASSEDCNSCALRRALDAEGFRLFDKSVPADFKHPFIEVWRVVPADASKESNEGRQHENDFLPEWAQGIMKKEWRGGLF
eukprot:NODE_8797_length_1469_cov_4.986587.p1 GENE.NODE_8797_length_1469_cov_4.986587~~NODE_8797_length_1469_cov_4.986587.p1  ORF type:complete len:340 (+),score=82.21 NODE_8797_length_1469_cov_4.986587:144-1163(+)